MLLATLFAGSGLLTYQVYSWVAKTGTDDLQLWLQLLTGLPFAVACSLRFMRPLQRAGTGILLDAITWVVAFRLGVALAGMMYPPLGLAIAGLVGALGVVAATGIGCSRLYSRRTLTGAALIGALAGSPFGLIVNRSEQENMILAICFPLWQIAVGLWIARRCATTES